MNNKRYTIKVIPLSKLTAINEGFTEKFFTDLLTHTPNSGKLHDKYFLLNTNLTMNVAGNELLSYCFNIFASMSRKACNLIQITKN